MPGFPAVARDSADQSQLASDPIQLRISVTPAVSTRELASGGMASGTPRAFMRAGSTERSGAPGAMSRALAMPRSPCSGTAPQALVSPSAVS